MRLQNAKLEAAQDSRITTTHYVLEESTHLGVLFQEEYDCLFELAKQRNAVAHGFTHGNETSGPAVELLAMVEMLLARDVLSQE